MTNALQTTLRRALILHFSLKIFVLWTEKIINIRQKEYIKKLIDEWKLIKK